MSAGPNYFLARKRLLKAETPYTILLSQQPKLSRLSDNEDQIINLANNKTKLNVLADIQTQLSTLVVNTSELNTLADIQTQLNTLADIQTPLSTLAGIQTPLSTLAGIQSSLSTLAEIQSQLSSLVVNRSELNTLAVIQTQLSTLSNNLSALSTLASQYIKINNLIQIPKFVYDLTGTFTAPNPNYGISYQHASIFLTYNNWLYTQALIPTATIASALNSFLGFTDVSSSAAFPSSQQNVLYLIFCAISTRHGGIDGTRATLLNNIVQRIDTIISTNFGSISDSLSGPQIIYLTAYINLFVNIYIIDSTIVGYMNNMLSGTGITLLSSSPFTSFTQSYATSLLANLSGTLTATMQTGLNGFINESSTTLYTLFSKNNVVYAGVNQVILTSGGGQNLSVNQYNILSNYFSGLTTTSYSLLDSTNRTYLSSFLSNAFTISYPITSAQVNTFQQALFYYTNTSNFYSAGITTTQATALNNLVGNSIGTVVAGLPLTPFQIGFFTSCITAIGGVNPISADVAADLSYIMNITVTTSGITTDQASTINGLLTDTTNIRNILSQTSTAIPTNSGTATAASALQAFAQALLYAGWGNTGQKSSINVSALTMT
jgi:hypothetical protein